MKTKIMKRRILALFLTLTVLLMCMACGKSEDPNNENNSTTVDQDREGNPITLPEKIDRVMSMGPSNTEILSALGCGDQIIAADEYSVGIEGINDDIQYFSMMAPDGEQIMVLQPDVIFVTGMSKIGGDDPFQVIKDAGICIIYIPASSSIDGIKEDIQYIADVMGKQTEGEEVIADMEKEIAEIKAIGDTITDKKTVYFEISAAPYMYSFGTGTYLHEMIEIAGAKNVLDDLEGWHFISEEAILNTNPDVIITIVDYIDDPVGEIKSRAGWDAVTAVQNEAIYVVDTDSSNRPSQNIVKALKEMVVAIYPEYYQ